MSKLFSDDKFKRVMKFLVASTEPPIAQLLAQRGFSDDDRKEGWELMDMATGRHLAVPATSGTFQTNYTTVLAKLDDWENIWFDVADAALGRTAPTVHERLFQNLSKVSGSEVLLTVKTFVSRIREMQAEAKTETDAGTGTAAETGTTGADAEIQAALAELTRRGLNEACLAEAEGLIVQLENEQIASPPVQDTAALKAAREEATAALWAWFLDWSKTARTVVKNRNYHVMLGLVSYHSTRSSSTSSSESAEDIVVDDPNDEAEDAASGM